MPLVKKDKLPERAKELFDEVIQMFDAFYDASGSIGKRYARMDEIGVPYCATIDHQTLEDDTVTLRDRDTMKQVRVAAKELCGIVWQLMNGEKKFEELK